MDSIKAAFNSLIMISIVGMISIAAWIVFGIYKLLAWIILMECS